MNELNIGMRDTDKKVSMILSRGKVPGVAYGPSMDSIPIKIKKNELMKALKNKGEVYEVDFHGNTFMAKVDEIQTHPVSHEPLHFSLVQLEKNKGADVEIPIEFKGTPLGVKKGGVLLVVNEQIPVNGKPKQIPNKIIADVSNLEIGDKITIKDLKVPKNIEVSKKEGLTIATCNPPQHMDEESELKTQSA